jgi:hypothetical protein
MNTKTCKAKGREFQNKVRDMYRRIGANLGLDPEDIEGRQMGGSGVDIVFSPRAKQIYFNHSIECKKHRRVVVPRLFEEHFDKYKNTSSLKLLFHENDRSETLVTMQAKDFMILIEKLIHLEEVQI